MTPSTPPKPPRPDGSFDFEITDFGEAREVLDNETFITPAEAALAPRPHWPGYWLSRRRERLPTDRALAGTTMDWLTKLPLAVRPLKLSEALPRVANQLAAVWSDQAQCLAAIDELLVDHRGGRRGLPLAMLLELQSLRDFAAERTA